MSRPTLFRATTAALSLLCPLAPTGTHAQEPEAASLEEVVVTARKREESVNSTPVAITAFSGADLAKLGMSDVLELQKATPGDRKSVV